MKKPRFLFALPLAVFASLLFAVSSLRAEESAAAVDESAPAVAPVAEVTPEAEAAEVVAESAAKVAPEGAIVGAVEGFLAKLAERGVGFEGETDFSGLYECIARVADPLARVLDAGAVEHFRNERMGLDFYPGLTLTVSNATPVVVGVSGSATNGVLVGDRVLSIGGASVTNVTLGGAWSLLRGHEAGLVELVLERGGAWVTGSVERVLSARPVVELSEVWPRQIGYAKVSGLVEGADSGKAIVGLLREWAAAGLAGGVLDLRGADGGDVESAVAVASPFAAPGALLFSMKDREWKDLADYEAREGEPISLPLMVLVDGQTSGAAELVAVAAEDRLRGVLVIGQETAGDPGIRDVVPLEDGQGLYIATRQLVSGGGAVYDGHAGVVPTVLISGRGDSLGFEPEPGPDRRAKLAEEATDRALRDRVRGDAALQRAVDVLLGLKALNIRVGSVLSGD